MDGILNLNKPIGPTSFELVRLVKQLTEEKRVGHGGTLDPLASGVLPILIGQATRVSEFFLHGSKAYRATVRLGVSTDTYDAEGTIVNEGDVSEVKQRDLVRVLESFKGPVWQRPPAFSALKRDGQRLYKLARSGRPVEVEERWVNIHRIELVDWSRPTAIIEIECGHGTYVRTIAHDLGEKLGCGGHLVGLVRTRTGPFQVDDALTIEALHDAFHGGYLQDSMFSVDAPLLGLPAAIVDGKLQESIAHGKAIPVNGSPHLAPDTLCRAFNERGEFIALMRFDACTEYWRPTKVFLR